MLYISKKCAKTPLRQCIVLQEIFPGVTAWDAPFKGMRRKTEWKWEEKEGQEKWEVMG